MTHGALMPDFHDGSEGTGRSTRGRLFLELLLLIVIVSYPAFAQIVDSEKAFSKATDTPDWRIELWETVVHYDHPTFANWSTPLGDINHDGYDDFAIATLTDTTFVFLGGDPFDHEPAFALFGGGSGFDVGDFNGDGLLDLVAGRKCGDTPCQGNRGEIFIYFQRKTGQPFSAEAVLIIRGEIDGRIGGAISEVSSNVRALDFNGDGYADLLTHTRDTRDFVNRKAVLYFGGPVMDTIPDLEFQMQNGNISSRYADDKLVGDFNGDGCDDALISASDFINHQRINYCDLYLGDPVRKPTLPDRILWPQLGWAPQQDWSCIVDINNDGFDDIVDGGPDCLRRERGSIPVFLGSATLPQKIIPNDSIPNYDPDPFGNQYPWISDNVGDMNGDGTDDCIIGWNTYFYSGYPLYFFYPGGNGFHTSTGYSVVSPGEYVVLGNYAAGDVNGDGYGDMIRLGHGSESPEGKGNRFQIHLGAEQLSTAVQPTYVAENPNLVLSPNPLQSSHGILQIHAVGLHPGLASLSLFNILGQQLRSQSISVTGSNFQLSIEAGEHPPGVYFFVLRQGKDTCVNQLIVL